jgi:hypothetical protein
MPTRKGTPFHSTGSTLPPETNANEPPAAQAPGVAPNEPTAIQGSPIVGRRTLADPNEEEEEEIPKRMHAAHPKGETAREAGRSGGTPPYSESEQRPIAPSEDIKTSAGLESSGKDFPNACGAEKDRNVPDGKTAENDHIDKELFAAAVDRPLPARAASHEGFGLDTEGNKVPMPPKKPLSPEEFAQAAFIARQFEEMRIADQRGDYDGPLRYEGSRTLREFQESGERDQEQDARLGPIGGVVQNDKRSVLNVDAPPFRTQNYPQIQNQPIMFSTQQELDNITMISDPNHTQQDLNNMNQHYYNENMRVEEIRKNQQREFDQGRDRTQNQQHETGQNYGFG